MSDLPLLPVRVLHSEPALGKVRALVATSDGPLWAGGDAGMVVEYGFEGLPLRRFHAHKGGVTCLAIAKGKLLSGGNDGHVVVWSTETLACLAGFPAPGKRVHAVRVDAVRGTVWALGRNGHSRVWRLAGAPVAIHEDRIPTRDILDEAGAVDMGGLSLRAVRDRVEAWTRQGMAWDVALAGIDRATAIAGTGKAMWVAGRGPQRSGLLARVPLADPTQVTCWRLPYAVACLTFWRGEGTVYAGGNGRLFAIDLPAW